MKHKPHPSTVWLVFVLALFGTAHAALAQAPGTTRPPPAGLTAPDERGARPAEDATTEPVARDRPGPMPLCLTALAQSTFAQPDAGSLGEAMRTARVALRRDATLDGFETDTDQP